MQGEGFTKYVRGSMRDKDLTYTELNMGGKMGHGKIGSQREREGGGEGLTLNGCSARLS